MKKVLIVDDETSVRALLRFQLEKAGYQVVEGVDGEEGIKLAGSEKPDLIFLDGMLPKKDGWQVCRQLKQNAATRATPIVLLTSCSQNIDELRGWESGADEYLTKPWDVDHLKTIAARFLEHAKPTT